MAARQNGFPPQTWLLELLPWRGRRGAEGEGPSERFARCVPSATAPGQQAERAFLSVRGQGASAALGAGA